MSIENRQSSIDHSAEWYAGGLRFACTQCGHCCTGPPGAVWFNDNEANEMATKLGMTVEAFRIRYARQPEWGGGNWSLNEVNTVHGYDCVFLDRTTVPGKAICSMYEARPSQCRTWPFWPENLKSRRHWESVKRNTPCPGMDASLDRGGTLVTVQQIRIVLASQRDC